MAEEGFEKGRIRQLQQERIYIQKKTFTKWMNSFLDKVNLVVVDMFTDLSDGKLLWTLLEIISGESLGRPNRGRLRLQKIENVNKCLTFLSTKVRLESIGAEDIVDGNKTLILGLIWTIILRFQIEDITIEVEESSETKSAKEALLLWCQRKTAGYPGVKIDNFSTSWRDGLGFNALIHSHCPQYIEYDRLSQHNHIDNLNNAFNAAYDNLGIAKLLDAEDVDVSKPDDKSIMTYVAAYYHYFAKMKTEVTGGKRITKIVGFAMEIDQMKQDYESLVSSLLDWVRMTISKLDSRDLPNVVEGIQRQMQRFKDYMIKEKPPRYREKGQLEAHFFNLCTKLKSNGHRLYTPPEGMLVKDIEKSWLELERAEYARVRALREELLRLERLEQQAERFGKKASLRESWLADMSHVLADHSYSTDTAQVEAAVKKHEALSAEILARKDRFQALAELARELVEQNYHAKEDVSRKQQQVNRKWTDLLERLEKKEQTVMGFNEMMDMLREMENIQTEIKEVESSVRSEDYGKHLLGTEDLVQKHILIEAQIKNQRQRMDTLNHKAKRYSGSHTTECAILQRRLHSTNSEFESLHSLSTTRRVRLEESKKFYQFVQDSEEEEGWIVEKQRMVKSLVTGGDLMACLGLLKKHEALEAEMVARKPRCDQVARTGESLVQQGHYAARDVKGRVDSVREKWVMLEELTASRRARLEDAEESHKYYQDANEAESWMREKLPLVCSEDYGKDESSAKKLLQRHLRLEEEIKSYRDDIERLDELASLMTKAHSKATKIGVVISKPSSSEYEEDTIQVPCVVEEEVEVMRDVVKETIEERKIAQVKARYKYEGDGMSCIKGEVMILLDETNSDWWKVRKSNRLEGYVPANYVKQVEPKVVQKKVKKTVTEPQMVKVKKTVFKTEVVKKPKRSSSLRRTPSVRSEGNLHFDRENVELRQSAINATYKRLSKLVLARKRHLTDAMQLFQFYRECDEFESWMADKEIVLKSKESLSEHVDSLRRKFEDIVTDLVANGGALDTINELANRIVKAGHSQQGAIVKRQQDINTRWQNLNHLKMEREKTLEGASSIELFQRTCDETKSWVQEKLSMAAIDDQGRDLNSVQNLQRKHQMLEREIIPVEAKLDKVELLASSGSLAWKDANVKTSYPNEAAFVNGKHKELKSLWKSLQSRVKDRRQQLDSAEKVAIFNEALHDLMTWVGQIQCVLSEGQLPWDVTSSESLLKEHAELRQEINSNKERFENVQKHGKNVMRRGVHNGDDIGGKLASLQDEQLKLLSVWEDRNKMLQDCHHVQLFSREADQIDVVTSGHEAFLEFDDLGSTLESVETLIKRHENFENTLLHQEERMNALSDMCDKLLAAGKSSSNGVHQRRQEVLSRRRRVKERSKERRRLLQESLAYQQFLRDSDELKSWLDEKLTWACDDSYRDLSNLQRKLHKHQAFEAELQANSDRLEVISKLGESLIQDDHYASAQIKNNLCELDKLWKDVHTKASDKGVKLNQAHQQLTLNKTLDNAQRKLDELEKVALSQDLGGDLRSVKKLHKEHLVLENELRVHANTMRDVVQHGQSLAHAGHFDSQSILAQIQDFDQRFENLQPSAKYRKQQLDASLCWHQFNYDVQEELQWISEHMPSATSVECGRTLVDTQNLFSKHQKLLKEVQGHHSMIQDILLTGQKYVSENHFAAQDIQSRADELKQGWDQLVGDCDRRKNELDLALKAQQFLSEVNEVESWCMEKLNVVSSQDYGRDTDAVEKLLTKHKALELDIGSYQRIVQDLQQRCDSLVQVNAPGYLHASQRQANVQTLINQLKCEAAERRDKLDESLQLHKYARDAQEFDAWLADQMQLACSEDYGNDFEHVQVLEKKFDEFKRNVETGSNRLHQCEALADDLVKQGHKDSVEIDSMQEELKANWEKLLEKIEERDHNLVAASEIHRFNCDVEEAMSRIQEKYSFIPDDLGRDLYGVQMLQRRHEAFENELVALEAQLQVLIDDSARLQEQYPGENAEQIEQQQSVVIDNWSLLQEKAAERKEALQASNDLHRFLTSARDLLSWSADVVSEMSAEVVVHDVGEVDLVKTRHMQLKAEMDAREDMFGSMAEAGQMMLDNGHSAGDEISSKLTQVLECREAMHLTWQNRSEYLSQLYDQQTFTKDINQLDAICASQEAYLVMPSLSGSVDQVEDYLKKHDAFEKLFDTQQDKLRNLQEFGRKLTQSKHYDSDNISAALDAITERRDYIKDVSADKRSKLEDALLYVTFNRDVSEAEAWIDEKLTIASEDMFTGVTSLQDKMKKLQKHQAFEAEIVANAERIERIKQDGDILLRRRHEQSNEIQHRVNKLLLQWNRLLETSGDRGKGLAEAKDILEFIESVDMVETWIREKEMIVLQGETGRDYEHCVELQRKMNDVGCDVRVDESKLKDINSLADKLITQGRIDSKMVETRKRGVNENWRKLQGSFNNHKMKLVEALEVHAFNRDMNDICERIHEKSAMLSSEDCGKDLASVQSLQRKNEETERDMIALQNQMERLETRGKTLCKKYPDHRPAIVQHQHKVLDDWESLESLCDNRKQKLNSSLQFHKLDFDVRDLIDWCHDMCSRMTSGQLPNDMSGARTVLEVHQERKAEIDGRSYIFENLEDSIDHLISKGHQASSNLNHLRQLLVEAKNVLHNTWSDRERQLTQCHNFQVFLEYAEQAEGWITGKEVFLTNEDLGETLSSVEELMRKHDSFEKTLQAQEEKIVSLEGFADDLCAKGHYATSDIRRRLRAVLDHRDGLKKLTTDRRIKLEESKKFQEFLRNIYELTGWINEKIQLAKDDSYMDLTNLKGKVQKHVAFQAEVSSNMNRVETLKQEGDGLLAACHYREQDISSLQSELDLCWQSLMMASDEKTQHLEEANQALLFTRTVEDLESWMNSVELQLSSDDYGKNLTSSGQLLKKHQLIEEEIQNHKEKFDELEQTCTALKQGRHFMSDELSTQCKHTVNRYKNLSEPCRIRGDNLNQSQALHQFFRDVEDELSWIQEKLPVVNSKDVGNSLTDVQNLMKKHQAIESEVVAHDPLIEAVTQTANDMISAGHISSASIKEQLHKLNKELKCLKDECWRRKGRLSDALESQTYYKDVSEALSWIEDKMPVLLSTDYGKDEETLMGNIKKLDSLELDVENFRGTVNDLSSISRDLIARKHFEYVSIEQSQKQLESKYEAMLEAARIRRQGLTDCKQVFEFTKEADSVIGWINTCEVTAASEDYGKDVEHVEVLEQRFEDFLHDLYTNETRIINVNSMADKLCTQGHGHSEVIKHKCNEVNQMWVEVKEMAEARQEALAGAKQVHSFDRDVDETLDWIQEKEAIVLQEDYGHDIESVQILLRRHEGLERDLVAISAKVETITSEANELLGTFPDAQEHIAAKHDLMVQSWNHVLDVTASKKDKLEQAEQLQLYFDDYRELLAWCNEILARITSEELARDVPGAELLINRHYEHRTEIDTRMDSFQKFTETGQTLIDNQHFLSNEIDEKVGHLNECLENVLKTWDKRRLLYEQSLDVLQLKHEMDQLDMWLGVREAMLQGDHYGESIDDVEGLIRKHEDFEKAVQAYEVKFTGIQRTTKLEDAFADQKSSEAKYRQEQRERERAALLKQEQERILKERQLLNNEKETATLQGTDYDGVEKSRLPATSSQVDLVRQAISMNRTNSFKDKVTGSPRSSRKMLVAGTSSFKSDDSGGSKTPTKTKRTPSFTTRKRTSSFKDKYRLPSQLPPVEMEAMLERQQEMQSGGIESTVRTWKEYYTVLCGQLMCFFKDKQGFIDNFAAAPPINLHKCKCLIAREYEKKKNAFRVNLVDGAEYMFNACSEALMKEWMQKIEFYAALPPSLQLTVFNPDAPTASLSGQSAMTPNNDDSLNVQDRGDLTRAEKSASVKELSSMFAHKSTSSVLEMPAKISQPRDQSPIVSSMEADMDNKRQPCSNANPKLVDRSSALLDHETSLLSKQGSNHDVRESSGSPEAGQSLKSSFQQNKRPDEVEECHSFKNVANTSPNHESTQDAYDWPVNQVSHPSLQQNQQQHGSDTRQPVAAKTGMNKASFDKSVSMEGDEVFEQSLSYLKSASPEGYQRFVTSTPEVTTAPSSKCSTVAVTPNVLQKRSERKPFSSPLLHKKNKSAHSNVFSIDGSRSPVLTRQLVNNRMDCANTDDVSPLDSSRLSPAFSQSSTSSTPPLPDLAPPVESAQLDTSLGESFDGTEGSESDLSPRKSAESTPEDSHIMPRFARPFGSSLGVSTGFGLSGAGGRPMFGSNIVSKNLQREAEIVDQKMHLYGNGPNDLIIEKGSNLKLGTADNEVSLNTGKNTKTDVTLDDGDCDDNGEDTSLAEGGAFTSPRQSAVSIKDRIKAFSSNEKLNQPNVQPSVVQPKSVKNKFTPSAFKPEAGDVSVKPSNVSARWPYGEDSRTKPTNVMINRFTGEPVFPTSPRSRTSSMTSDDQAKLNESDDFNDQIVSAMYGEIVFGNQGNLGKTYGGYVVSDDEELDSSTEEEDEVEDTNLLCSPADGIDLDDDWPDLPDNGVPSSQAARYSQQWSCFPAL